MNTSSPIQGNILLQMDNCCITFWIFCTASQYLKKNQPILSVAKPQKGEWVDFQPSGIYQDQTKQAKDKQNIKVCVRGYSISEQKLDKTITNHTHGSKQQTVTAYSHINAPITTKQALFAANGIHPLWHSSCEMIRTGQKKNKISCWHSYFSTN